ncbi:hypothetical protein [Galactobacter sp.]|uniref:hypothetical protein n=1 Tax=Galactobacter sp. TaxID=2676125 RepID=UPI0025BEC85E|nr:hypothetical protein [Galactobacter sp.]
MKTIGPKYLKTAAASVGIAALLALTACSGSDDEKPAPESTTSSAAEEETTEAPAPEETEESEETAAAEESEDNGGESADGELTEIKASSDKGTDSVLEHSFEATGIALGFKGSGDRVDPPGNNKYVAIKVKATAGTKYSNGLSCTAFKLQDDKASTPKGSYSLVKDRLEELGLTPFETVRRGETGEGWCAYYLENPTKDNLTLVYSRLGLKDSSSGKEEPPESKELKITPEG